MPKQATMAFAAVLLISTQSFAALGARPIDETTSTSDFPPPKSGKGYNFPKEGRAADDYHMPFYVDGTLYKRFPNSAKPYFFAGALDGLLLGIRLNEDNVPLDFIDTCKSPSLEELRTRVGYFAKLAMNPPPKMPGSNAEPVREKSPAHVAVFLALRGLCNAKGAFTLRTPLWLWDLDQYASWRELWQITYATGVVDGMRVGAANQQKGLKGLDACVRKSFAFPNEELQARVDDVVNKWPTTSKAPAAYAVLVAALWNLCTDERLREK